MGKGTKSGRKNLKHYMIILIVSIVTEVLSISIFIFCAILRDNNMDMLNDAIIDISIVIALIAMGLMAFTMILTYKNIFAPLKQFYHGMEQGAAGSDEKTLPTQKGETEGAFFETKNEFDRLDKLIPLIENLNKNLPFKEILKYAFDSFKEYIPYTYIGVALIEDGGKTIKASYGIPAKQHANLPKRLLGYTADIESTSLGHIIETGQVRVINDLEAYLKNKPLTEYNRILLEEGIRSSITFPLKNNGYTVGIIFFSSNCKNIYNEKHIKFLQTLANSITLGLEKSILMDDMIVGSVQALARLAEQRDSETGEHLNRMKTYSRTIAEILSNSKKYGDIIDLEYINNIERFSPLHDIGKVGIRDDILLKPGKLTNEEFEIMKTHTIYGAWVLRTADQSLKKRGRSIFGMGIEIAEGHHEKWDGTGYPYGKAKEDIPLSARIVSVADVFDALTSKRPYKKPFTYDESCRIISEGAGRNFDPYIVEMFNMHNDKIKQVYDDFKIRKML